MRPDITPGQTSGYLGFDLVVDDKSIHEWLKEEPGATPESLPAPEPTSEPSGS